MCLKTLKYINDLGKRGLKETKYLMKLKKTLTEQHHKYKLLSKLYVY
jgi:hypothetical protein